MRLPASSKRITNISRTMKVKVCGMRHPIDEIAELGPDYLGFIFWNGSRRYFTGPPGQLPANSKKVGVFVDAGMDEVLHLSALYRLDAIQLHGNETPSYMERLRARMQSGGKKETLYIKAFSVGAGFDFSMPEEYLGPADFFLFDTRGALPGGNGRRFDWTLLEDYPWDKDLFLSGGIRPEHLEEIKKLQGSSLGDRIHAVDINSGFESAPGIKDVERIRPFIEGLKKPLVTKTK